MSAEPDLGFEELKEFIRSSSLKINVKKLMQNLYRTNRNGLNDLKSLMYACIDNLIENQRMEIKKVETSISINNNSDIFSHHSINDKMWQKFLYLE